MCLKVAAPNDFYEFNPYDDTSMPSSYASTTAFLNINTDDLAAQAVGEFYGNVQVGEVLVADSGARAVVKDRRLISDSFGKMGASFFIPNAAVDTNPRWATGTRSYQSSLLLILIQESVVLLNHLLKQNMKQRNIK